jgi:DNA-binding response OmpR family regulator
MTDMRILIVDDEEELVTTLVERMELRGLQAVGVTTGHEAVGLIEREPFDVVVLDVKMPGEDGVEIMKRIKKIRSDLPVILLTGHMSMEASEEGLKAGAIDYIIKPIQIDDLIAKMKEAISIYQRRSKTGRT